MIPNKVDPYKFDWGTVSVEGFNEEEKKMLLVFNIDISSTVNVNRSTIFIIGRSLWLKKELPEIAQKIVLDLRGQPLSLLDRARQMKKEILQKLISLNIEPIIEILI